MSAHSQVALPVWAEIAQSPRAGVLARVLASVRRALATRLSQWAQSAIQQEAQRLRETAHDVAHYDGRVAAEMRMAADRHEWTAR